MVLNNGEEEEGMKEKIIRDGEYCNDGKKLENAIRDEGNERMK